MLKPFWSKKKKLSYTAEQVNDAIGQVIEGGGGSSINGGLFEITISGSPAAISHIEFNDTEVTSDFIESEEGAQRLSLSTVFVYGVPFDSSKTVLIGNFVYDEYGLSSEGLAIVDTPDGYESYHYYFMLNDVDGLTIEFDSFI